MNKEVHTAKATKKPSPWLQILVSFVIPIIILTRFSGEDRLGPAWGLVAALAFPVAYEAYNMLKHRKFSYGSLLAIGGILVTGAISLLGLSENWLAIRRGVPYLAVSIALLVSVLIRRPLLNAALPLVLDMEIINERVREKRAQAKLSRLLTWTSHAASILLALLALISYAVTKVIIISQTDTAGFNQEYARLRIMSLLLVTLPLLIGATGILYRLVNTLEKLTGLDFEAFLKKR